MRQAILAILLIAMPGCSGYHVGNRSLYAPDIQTIYVPMFESNSYRRHLGERLTEAVVKQIELRTPYKVVGSPDADSVLTGRIISDTKRVVVNSQTDEGRKLEHRLLVHVTWTNRCTGQVYYDQAVPLDVPAIDITQASYQVPEIGQSVATGLQQAIDQVAERVACVMEQPW